MSKKLPVNSFKSKTNMLKFNEEFTKSYKQDSDKGYILELDVDYPKDLYDLHDDAPFLPEKMEINKCNKLGCNMYDKKCTLFT